MQCAVADAATHMVSDNCTALMVVLTSEVSKCGNALQPPSVNSLSFTIDLRGSRHQQSCCKRVGLSFINCLRKTRFERMSASAILKELPMTF